MSRHIAWFESEGVLCNHQRGQTRASFSSVDRYINPLDHAVTDNTRGATGVGGWKGTVRVVSRVGVRGGVKLHAHTTSSHGRAMPTVLTSGYDRLGFGPLLPRLESARPARPSRTYYDRLHESRFFCYRFKVAPKVKVKVKVKSTLYV